MHAIILLIGLLVASLPLPATAHNGEVAIAVPMQPIVIDGNFSDWPHDRVWYPLDTHSGWDSPLDTTDYTGRFTAGYNIEENALYFAVEVRDESIILDTENPTYNSGDGCELYLDLQHAAKARSIGQYHIHGNQLGIFLNEVSTSEFSLSAQRTAKTHRYEWRVDIGAKTQGQVQLQPYMILGADISPLDKDADGSYTQMAWGNVGGRFASSSLGDILLSPQDIPTSRLQGHVVWEDGNPLRRGHVSIRPLAAAQSQLTATTDTEGRFAVDLPAGRYRVEPGSSSGAGVAVELQLDHVVLDTLIIPAPIGQSTPAGPGQKTPAQAIRIPAGYGRKQGSWRTLSIADGLPDPTITDIVQDSAGDLWLATNGGGVARYTGEEITVYQHGLGSNAITGVLQARDGAMWFAAGAGGVSKGGGLSRLAAGVITTYSTDDGLPSRYIRKIVEDKKGQLWLATPEGLCRFAGQNFTLFTTADGLVNNSVFYLALDRQDGLWIGTEGGLSYYDGYRFVNYTQKDGLPAAIESIALDRKDRPWVGTWRGLGHLHGDRFMVYTQKDGLAEINDLLVDRQGHLWAATYGGVSHYDGSEWTTHTAEDGLAQNVVGTVYEDQSGDLWFGSGYSLRGITAGSGVSHYTRSEFKSWPTAVGIMGLALDHQGQLWLGTWNGVMRLKDQQLTPFAPIPHYTYSLVEDRQQRLWFGHSNGQGASMLERGQLHRYTQDNGLDSNILRAVFEDSRDRIWLGANYLDGERIVNFTSKDGLTSDEVYAIGEDKKGHIWIGTRAGLNRWDGEQLTSFTTADGLTLDNVTAILGTRDGAMWFGTWGSGLHRYDGENWTTFIPADGLGHNRIEDIMEDSQGHLWISTFGGGLTRYDGLVFQTLLKEDGLVHDAVHQVVEGADGTYWIATEGGLTRFQPRISPPGIRLDNIVADRDYAPTAALRFPATQDYIAFQFQGSSLKTRPNQIAYVYRLQGLNSDWQVTREHQVVYRDLPIGDYTFEVKAVDRDLTYSATPAQIRLSIHPAYDQIALWAGLGLSLVGLVFAGGYALQKRRGQLAAERALMHEMEDELDTARDLQMGLMPTEAPQISGYDLAGHCETVNHVGGDFYQYFDRGETFAFSLADVTGHAMEAAIPVVMFSGILDSEIRHEQPQTQLFARLNQTLHHRLDRRTYVCFLLGQLNPKTGALQLSNSGCPYPYHFKAATGTVVEIQLDAYPLGVRADSTYETSTIQLDPGDFLIFCSDGIIEAENAQGELFGYERITEIIRSGSMTAPSAEGLLQHIMTTVQQFMGEVPRGDDQTLVILGVKTDLV